MPARRVTDADRIVVVDGGDLAERLVDEDEWDEHGKALLGESSDVAHEEAQVEHDDQKQNYGQPEADPEPQRHKVYSIRTANTQPQNTEWPHRLHERSLVVHKLTFVKLINPTRGRTDHFNIKQLSKQSVNLC